MKRTADIAVIGAGVIGLTTALRLTQRGLKTLLIERSGSGREASWAGAGMLPPGNSEFAGTPEARLRAFSHTLWDDFADELHHLTGIDTGYVRCGAIELNDITDPQHLPLVQKQMELERIAYEKYSPSELHSKSPFVGSTFTDAIFIPDFGQVRNPRHLKALEAACQQTGVEFITDDQVSLCRDTSGVVSIESSTEAISCAMVCVTAGAWSGSLLEPIGIQLPVRPVRGQIAQLRPERQLFDHVIQIGRRYLVPRKDGLVLVGSTEDHDGFSKRVTSAGMRELLQFAEQVVPELKSAEVVRQWAGLRPGSPDELPFLGAASECENLFVAAGHFRSGLQMSIGTATLMCQLICGDPSDIDLEGLLLDRLTRSVAGSV